MRRKCCSGGFSLIEVLVTVVIIAIGLLGLASMQSAGIKLNHDSLLRSKATLAAYDLADRIRANKDYRDSYDTGSGASDFGAEDRVDWLNDLSQELPNGTGTVDVANERVTITILWKNTRNAPTGTPATDQDQSFTLQTDI
ncbi:MAG: type IV pilus modification protein PilV [Candidatus Sedimenticola sp. 20ELBAFRAG]